MIGHINAIRIGYARQVYIYKDLRSIDKLHLTNYTHTSLLHNDDGREPLHALIRSIIIIITPECMLVTYTINSALL